MSRASSRKQNSSKKHTRRILGLRQNLIAKCIITISHISPVTNPHIIIGTINTLSSCYIITPSKNFSKTFVFQKHPFSYPFPKEHWYIAPKKSLLFPFSPQFLPLHLPYLILSKNSPSHHLPVHTVGLLVSSTDTPVVIYDLGLERLPRLLVVPGLLLVSSRTGRDVALYTLPGHLTAVAWA